MSDDQRPNDPMIHELESILDMLDEDPKDVRIPLLGDVDDAPLLNDLVLDEAITLDASAENTLVASNTPVPPSTGGDKINELEALIDQTVDELLPEMIAALKQRLKERLHDIL